MRVSLLHDSLDSVVMRMGDCMQRSFGCVSFRLERLQSRLEFKIPVAC